MKAAEIVQDLLTLARRGVATKKTLSLNPIAGDFIASPEYRMLVEERPNLDLGINLSQEILNIVGSETHISKTVMNLVANAVDAMPAGGRITISTRNSYIDIVPNQRAIIASGYAEAERVRETQRIGAGACVKKPFTLEKIGLAVRAALDRNSRGRMT